MLSNCLQRYLVASQPEAACAIRLCVRLQPDDEEGRVDRSEVMEAERIVYSGQACAYCAVLMSVIEKPRVRCDI